MVGYPPAWDGSLGVSNTRWWGDWRGSCNGGGWTEVGSKPWRRRRERSRGLIKWKSTFGKGWIRSRSILRRYRLWTCVRRRRGIRGHKWVGGGGKRQYFTWQGQGRRRWQRRRRSQTRRVWRNKVWGLKRNTLELGQRQWLQRSAINKIGTESSVSVASVHGMEHHRPTMRTPLGHRDCLRRRIRRRRSGTRIGLDSSVWSLNLQSILIVRISTSSKKWIIDRRKILWFTLDGSFIKCWLLLWTGIIVHPLIHG